MGFSGKGLLELPYQPERADFVYPLDGLDVNE